MALNSRKEIEGNVFRCQLSMDTDTQHVFSIFKSACNKAGFYVSDRSDTSITAIHSRHSFLDSLFACLSSQDRQGTIVQLSIIKSKRHSSRILCVRGLQGSTKLTQQLISTFMLNKSSFERQTLRVNTEAEEMNSYEINRILASSESKIGSVVLAEIKGWTTTTHLNPQTALSLVKKLINEVTSTFTQEFGYLNPVVLTQGVEKFIFSKTIPQISELYANHFAENDSDFARILKELQKMPTHELMKSFELKPQFTLGSDPYFEAIKSLQEMEKKLTPLEKLNTLLEANTLMRTCVVDHWKAKHELKTMDDELPVIIFVVSQVQPTHFPSQISLLLDYVADMPSLENEYRILVNIDSAISFIVSNYN